ncbi:pyrimidine-specific ribonucleoside hydrolase riha [Plakobranchus ocellatus]|uniref:Pyrimidine-specific ribonucleoside hydrolase riha n=1 Tax=Plakobranchus ocellatus TaxID=259542 RepID=A0AAV3YBX4_9GAST|nr:pyrimidine-specific ribonucleoside hydrolase riha [Plakobranchus ocellatus]
MCYGGNFPKILTWAIFLAASRPDLELTAISCVAGQVSVLNACENALRVLKACGREDVHVCRGAEKSLLGLFGKSENLPGIAWTRKMDGHVQAEHSVSSLIRCVNENPGEISLVCLGPLTNLALALRLDPLIATNLRELIIVGGNIEGHGNISSCSEQNFLFDPEAAHIVLQEVQDAVIVPLEVGQRHSIPFTLFTSWLNADTDISNFLIESVTQEELQQQAKCGVVSPEVFAVAMVIDPSIILEKEKLYTTVELKGDYSRGLMVVDRRGHLNKPANVFVVKNLDLGKTQALFGSLFAGAMLESQAPAGVVCLAGSTGGSREQVPVLFKEGRVTVL